MLQKTPPSKKRRAERRTEKRNEIRAEKSEERKRGTNGNGEVRRAEKRNTRGTEKFDECKKERQQKNGKEHAAGEEKNVLQLYYAIGQARLRTSAGRCRLQGRSAVLHNNYVLIHRTGQAPDISWPSSRIGTVSCTAVQSVLSHRTGPDSGH